MICTILFLENLHKKILFKENTFINVTSRLTSLENLIENLNEKESTQFVMKRLKPSRYEVDFRSK